MHDAAKALEDSANNTWVPEPLLDVSWFMPEHVKDRNGSGLNQNDYFYNFLSCNKGFGWIISLIYFGPVNLALRALPAIGPRGGPAARAGPPARGQDLEAVGVHRKRVGV